MDNRKIKKYQTILTTWLGEYAARRTRDEIEYQCISDTKLHHYQVVKVGWADNSFCHNIIFHFQIKDDGKVWLLVNNTDILVTDDLIELGIPKSEIVLGFQPIEIRAFSGYATA